MTAHNPATPPRGTRAPRRPALLAFAGPPTPAQLAVMVSCAANLERDLFAVTVGTRLGTVLSTRRAVAQVAAAVHRAAATLVVVAGETPARSVRGLAAATQRPVLIARTRRRWRLVLAATDLRARGAPVVAAGAAIASACRARAVVLHNVEPAEASRSAAGPRAAPHVTRRLRRLARLAARTTPPAASLVSSAASPEQAIVEAAAWRRADLIVIGMRRPDERRADRCADGVIAEASTNVMVVPLGASRDRPQEEVTP